MNTCSRNLLRQAVGAAGLRPRPSPRGAATFAFRTYSAGPTSFARARGLPAALHRRPGGQLGAAGTRSLATDSAKDDDPHGQLRRQLEAEQFEVAVEQVKEKEEKSVLLKIKAGAYSAAGLGAVGATWYMTKWTLQGIGAVYSSPHTIAYVGFWAGSLTTTCFAAVAFGLYRMTHIRPENVYRQSYDMLRKDPEAQRVLGSNILASKLKTYEITGGKFGVDDAAEGNGADAAGGTYLPLGVRWKNHRCQMIYLCYGEKKMGLVTVEARKVMSLVPGRLDIKLLAVDVLDKDAIEQDTETVMLRGNKGMLDDRQSNIYSMLDMKMNFRNGR